MKELLTENKFSTNHWEKIMKKNIGLEFYGELTVLKSMNLSSLNHYIGNSNLTRSGKLVTST